MTHDVTAEGQWYDPDTGQVGPTYPYTDSLITAQRVLGGDRVSRARSDIENEFAPLPPAPPIALGDHGELVITTAEEIAAALQGLPISRTLPTRAGIVITADVTVRDAMISAALDHAQAGAELWTHIARRLRGQPRAEALTIAAACYCLLGDSIRAGIATDTALDEAQPTQTPPPRLALLLLTALRAGIPAPADPPRHHRRHHPRLTPTGPQGPASSPTTRRAGRAPFFLPASACARRAPRDRRTGHLAVADTSVAPHLLLAVSGVPSMTDRDPVAVNPRPAGSPVLRSRRPDGRLPLRPCGTGGIYRPYDSSPRRRCAPGSPGRKSASCISAGLFGVDIATPPVPPHPSAERREPNTVSRKEHLSWHTSSISPTVRSPSPTPAAMPGTASANPSATP